MSIESRKVGERVELGEGVFATLLNINRNEVKLGLCCCRCSKVASENELLACLHSESSQYFFFPQGGQCTLVVRCDVGKSIAFNGTAMLTVLSISAGNATLRIDDRCSGAFGAVASSQKPPYVGTT